MSSFSRLFGHGNGAILAIIFFFCLFILENKLNYDDEIMVMQNVWYPLWSLVPGFIVSVGAKILQHFDHLATSPILNIPYSLLAMYGFIIVGIVIPCSMINRSKKCKKFVLKKILTPLIICRNWQWIEINQKGLRLLSLKKSRKNKWIKTLEPSTDYGHPMKAKIKETENLGRCGRQNMLRPYLKFGSGSGFWAVQGRWFPHWASVVRAQECLLIPLFVKNFKEKNFYKFGRNGSIKNFCQCHDNRWQIV